MRIVCNHVDRHGVAVGKTLYINESERCFVVITRQDYDNGGEVQKVFLTEKGATDYIQLQMDQYNKAIDALQKYCQEVNGFRKSNPTHCLEYYNECVNFSNKVREKYNDDFGEYSYFVRTVFPDINDIGKLYKPDLDILDIPIGV